MVPRSARAKTRVQAAHRGRKAAPTAATVRAHVVADPGSLGMGFEPGARLLDLLFDRRRAAAHGLPAHRTRAAVAATADQQPALRRTTGVAAHAIPRPVRRV